MSIKFMIYYYCDWCVFLSLQMEFKMYRQFFFYYTSNLQYIVKFRHIFCNSFNAKKLTLLVYHSNILSFELIVKYEMECISSTMSIFLDLIYYLKLIIKYWWWFMLKKNHLLDFIIIYLALFVKIIRRKINTEKL